jgi:hypothetical protein
MKKKKYSLNVQNDRVVSVEIDGVVYSSPDKIPDPEDQARMEFLVNSFPGADFGSSAESSGLPRIVFGIFLGVAVLMLVIFSISAFFTARGLSKEVSAQGQVIEMLAQRDSEGTILSFPVVQFFLPDGSRVTARISEGSYPPAYQVDQEVTVLYDPRGPEVARIKSFGSTLLRWTLPIISGILAAAFILAAFFARWIARPII